MNYFLLAGKVCSAEGELGCGEGECRYEGGKSMNTERKNINTSKFPRLIVFH